MINAKKQNGVALVLVLWMLVLLIIMATGYSRMMRTETLLTANMVHSAQAQALAEAGVYQAITELLKPVNEQLWKTDGTNYPYQFGDETTVLQIRAETGKIDLNTASSELLFGLLQSVNIPKEELLSQLQAILDWRDKDKLTRTHGAEDTDYENAGEEYGAKDGPFNSLDELLLVQGMTPELYRKIRPALTIYSHQAGIYPQSAPREALLAIPLMTEETVEEYLVQRVANDDPNKVIPLPGVDSKYLSKGKGSIFSITSEAKINNTRARLDVVVSMRSYNNHPYIILAWHEASMRNEQIEAEPG